MEKNQTQRPPNCTSFSLRNKKLYESNTPVLQAICSSIATLTTPKGSGFMNLIKIFTRVSFHDNLILFYNNPEYLKLLDVVT